MFLGYCRVSTIEQASKESTSIAEQERVIRGVSMTRGISGYDVQIFSDPGISGSIPLERRPAGKELLAIAKKGDVICSAKLDRMFRSASDALTTAERLKNDQVNLILVDLGILPVTDNGMAKCFFTMAAAFAELERGRIAERMEQGRRGKRQRNGHLGGVAPYGFRVNGHGKTAALEAVPDEHKILLEALALAEGGQTSWRVMEALNERGYHDRQGKPFSCYQVKRIIERGLGAER